ncbi:hypothetical protein T484DRAFT_1758395 [Baffinella frigidus]|nr:hypothetical protein T484DRAFT_1758395 [Cryptophyta sp. CCMP2293]
MLLAKPNAPHPKNGPILRPRAAMLFAAAGGAARPARPVEETVMVDTHLYGASDDMTEDEAVDGPCGNKVCVQNESRLNQHLEMNPRLTSEHKKMVNRIWELKMEHSAAVETLKMQHSAAVETLKATHKAALKAQKQRLAPVIFRVCKACKREKRSRRDLKALEVADQLDTQVMVRDLKKDNAKFRKQNHVLLGAV